MSNKSEKIMNFVKNSAIAAQNLIYYQARTAHLYLQFSSYCCYVQHQSTYANTHLPPGSHAKRRGKKKTTTDIIQVKGMSISESHAKVTRVTNRSFEQTLSALSPSLVNTNSKASTDKIMDVSKENLYSYKNSLHEQLKSAYFALENVNVQKNFTPQELKQAHSQLIQLITSLEKSKGSLTLSAEDMKNIKQSAVDDIAISIEQPILKDAYYTKDDDPIRWNDPVRWNDKPNFVDTVTDPHTYNTIECDNGFENVIKDVNINTNIKIQPNEITGLDDVNIMPSVLSGFASLAEETPSVIKEDKVTKKRKKKVVSTKMKKSAKSKKKVLPMDETQVMNETEQELNVFDLSHVTTQFGQYYPMEEEIDLSTSKTPSKSKNKKGNKKKKKNKEVVEEEQRKYTQEVLRRGREASFNQSLQSYLSVCVNVGMLNRATHTLLYYRSDANSNLKINTVEPYNILLWGLAKKSKYERMMEVLECLQEDHVTPDVNTYAAFLSCLGSKHSSPDNTEAIFSITNEMNRQGINLQDIFTDADLIKDHWNFILNAVHRISPNFEPMSAGAPVELNCSLVNTINDTLHSSQVPSLGARIITKEQLKKWTDEQFTMELDGKLTINSIEKKNNDRNVNFFREKLKSWETRWEESFYRTFVEQVEALRQSFFSHRRDKPLALYPYLVALPTEDYIEIMLEEMRTLAIGSEGFSPSRRLLNHRVGERVYNRYAVRYKKEAGIVNKMRTVYDNYCNWYMDDKGSGVTYMPRVCWQELMKEHSQGINLEHRPVKWPQNVMCSVGETLYNIMISKAMVWKPLNSEKHTYPALYEIERTYGYRVIEEIKPSPTLMDLLRKSGQKQLSFDSRLIPMLTPPVPWISSKLGGFLINDAELVRLMYGAHSQKQRMEECGNQQLYPSMDALNKLSSVPWRVNTPMLDTVIEVFNKKGSPELDIPQPPSECPVPPKIKPDMTSKEVHEIRRARMEYYKTKSEMHSLWCDALYKISLANHFRDRIFWFPHNMDFRGRVYPYPPHLNHITSDVFRSIIHFAQGKPLGKRGLRWLKLHLINLTGIKKRTNVEDRVRYCEEILDDILDSADNPLTGRRWWVQSDEPWQTLAACKELANALRSGDPENYISHLPIHQDGSCNGLQHYAALGRDQAGAESVNLTPMHVPQDVYSDIAVLVEEKRKKDAAAGVPIAQTLEGYVRRKVIKQTVMTTVYGVTHYGAKLQIEKQLKALDDYPADKRFGGASYLCSKTFESLEQMFTSTKEIQDWLTESARSISQVCDDKVEWVTPLGLPVVQPYTKTQNSTKMINGKLPTSFSMDIFQRPNVMKQKNAFAPNFVHSLDSSHMMLTALYCQQAGISFVSVHDCFWTHASSVDTMSKICVGQYSVLMSELSVIFLRINIIPRLCFTASAFAHDGSALDASKLKINTLLARVPPKGNFNLQEVLKSVYFFS
ncbi:unnamed protein product, partial [Meganyctiphanes norvegica]